MTRYKVTDIIPTQGSKAARYRDLHLTETEHQELVDWFRIGKERTHTLQYPGHGGVVFVLLSREHIASIDWIDREGDLP